MEPQDRKVELQSPDRNAGRGSVRSPRRASWVLATVGALLGALPFSSTALPIDGSSACAPGDSSLSRSEQAAYIRSLMGTAAPVLVGISIMKLALEDNHGGAAGVGAALAAAGILIGPSLGYFHAGCPERGVRGIMLRSGTAALTGVVAAEIASQPSSGFANFSNFENAAIAVLFGCGLVLVEAMYDVDAVKGTVRARNAELLSSSKLRIGPALLQDGRAPGLRAEVRLP